MASGNYEGRVCGGRRWWRPCWACGSSWLAGRAGLARHPLVSTTGPESFNQTHSVEHICVSRGGNEARSSRAAAGPGGRPAGPHRAWGWGGGQWAVGAEPAALLCEALSPHSHGSAGSACRWLSSLLAETEAGRRGASSFPSLHPTLNSQAEQGREQQIRNQHRGASPGILSPRSRSLSEAALSSRVTGLSAPSSFPPGPSDHPSSVPPPPGLPGSGTWSLCTGGAHVSVPVAAPGPVPASALVSITAPPGVLTALRGARNGRPRPSGVDSVSEPAFIS